MSSRQLRRLTIAPRRGEGRALRFVASEVPHGPRGPPNAIMQAGTQPGLARDFAGLAQLARRSWAT